jgi:hypothetical protein
MSSALAVRVAVTPELVLQHWQEVGLDEHGGPGMPAADKASRSRRAVATDTSSSSASSAAVARPRAWKNRRAAKSRSARTV